MSAFPSPEQTLESVIQAEGAQLLALMDKHPAPSLFSKKGVHANLMNWAMRDAAFKTQLFRFVDVLPSLKTSGEIVRHLDEYLGDKAVELNPAMKAGLAASALVPALVAGPVKANVTSMAAQFVAGETPADLAKRFLANAEAGMATTIDLLGETVVSEEEADEFLRRNLEVLDALSACIKAHPAPCQSDLGPDGPLPRLNLSVKVSALAADVNPIDPEGALAAMKQRLYPILRRAAELKAFVNLDMESYRLKNLTLELFKAILEDPEFAAQPPLGIALQAYLRDCEADLLELISWVRRRQRRIGVRLVKGAYWDYETITARQRGWPVPVWTRKEESDANFEKLSDILLRNTDVISPAFATHNVRSCAQVIARASRLGVDKRTFEFQALYGMADDLKSALISSGHRVREYCAIGALLPGMAYLVRRLLENTSNEGFLRRKNTGEATFEQLLRNPVLSLQASPGPVEASKAKPGIFQNAPNTDFTIATHRASQRSALEAARRYSAKICPLVIDGRRITDRDAVSATNPARPSQTLGRWARATVRDADIAVAAARKAFPAWRATPAERRAQLLERVADLIEARRFQLNALEILEAGKPWAEADGDISEAIDFCRFYAAEMRRLEAPQVTQAVPGERCCQSFTPRGVGVAIAPWNFPLAILAGLTVAPLVAGNCVIMKPAEQTTLVAWAFMEILMEAGVPSGALHFLPGLGEEIGAHLVAHPGVDFVAFTGSRNVGLKIWETAGRTAAGQANLKKVVCEMGGKNALIIDSDADLNEAIPAALASAFGFSGQKCSALSRLIVMDDIYDDFVARFTAACASVPLGDPSHPGTIVGPVIDTEARDKILGLVETGKKEAKLVFQAKVPTSLSACGGFYVPPTVFAEVKPEAVIAREEIFGPVVAILRAKDLDEAFAIANGTDYALTGGLFSRSPRNLERAERELLVGNIYLNRAITGAIVERHPFGGFRMSGGGSKAGGRGYLENFLFPRAITENVLRRGFAPSEDI